MDPVEICTRAQQEMFAQGDPAAVDTWTTPDVVDHAAPPGAPSGRDGIRSTIAWLHSGLDDIRYEIETGFASGDLVTMRNTVGGTHVRPWMGAEPTGRSFTVNQIHIFRVQDGRIAEHWACRDDLGMMRQLGLLPQPATA